MSEQTSTTSGIAVRLAGLIQRRGAVVIAAAIVATAGLVVPLLAMQPDSTASGDPAGEVFDTQDLVDDRFASSVYSPAFIVEARDGDVLSRDSLLELWSNEEALRASELSDRLLTLYSAELGAEARGISTVADAVDAALRADGVAGLQAATEDQVKTAVSAVLADDSATRDLRNSLSVGRMVESRTVAGQMIDYWTAQATVINALADNDALGGGSSSITLGNDDTTKEEFARDVETLLRGKQDHNRVWGIAIDVNLTSAEQGATAGPFISFTIITVLLMVGIVLRSYWAVAVIGAALAALMIWLKGIANLIGLESSLIMDFIVPIAMISFGVDFAFHAIGRYREEHSAGSPPDRAFALGLSGVLGALLLALLSDSAAFLSNVTSGIPSVIQFGIGASVALGAAFVMLGIVAPLTVARIEGRFGARHQRSKMGRIRVIAAASLTAVAAGFAVLFLVFFPPIGVAAIILYVVMFLVVPAAVSIRRATPETMAAAPAVVSLDESGKMMGRLVLGFAHARFVLLPVVALGTAAAISLAIQVETKFDVKDYFSADSDFVVSLDKIDEHFGETGGEPAVVYIEGNLADPGALVAIEQFVQAVDDLGSSRFARTVEGELQVSTTLPEIVRAVFDGPAAASTVESSTGVPITDADGDGLPDTAAGVAAVLSYASQGGIPLDAERLRYTPDDVGQVLWSGEGGSSAATIVVLPIPGTRAVENIQIARDELSPLTDDLQQALGAGARVSVAGGPIIRQESLDATSRALQLSLPIAVVLCLVLTAVFMRSLRLAVVSTIPILLVVSWLYAFMYALDFNLNLVTATIGAISIGVGGVLRPAGGLGDRLRDPPHDALPR